MLGGIVHGNTRYVLLIRGRAIRYDSDWEDWPGTVPERGQQIEARGDLEYGTDVRGSTYGKLMLTSLEVVP